MAALKIKRNSKYFSIHTHTRYSNNDAMPKVSEVVKRASELGYPALGVTDHGNIAASVQLYKECKKVGIKPLPGTELYFVDDREDKKAKRRHLCLLAYTTQGYRNLVHISTLTHQNFHHKPLIDYSDMAQLHEEGRTEGLALTTGCYFGPVIQTLITHGYEAAKQIVATFASWFDTYVEIQNHQIDHGEGVLSERNIAYALMSIARELNLPVVITQDSHYTHEDHKPHHEALKSLVTWSEDVSEAVFPGDGFHMVDDEWMREHHREEVWSSGPEGIERVFDESVYEAGIAGLHTILSKYDMFIDEMENYEYKVPQLYPDPDAELYRRTYDALVSRLTYGSAQHKQYHAQLLEELDTIAAAGMANYMLMVAEVCDHMRDVAMFFQIRGSAAGSLVCWLLGITPEDPIRWKLRFDRFLSKDRTKPPDIDIDIEHSRRKELMEWIATKYAVVQICNWGTYSIGGDADDHKGSLRVKYLSRARKTGGITDWNEVPASDKQMLVDLSDNFTLISSPGVHAAGLVVMSSESELRHMVPMQWIASSETMVTQFDMKDVEEIGLVKLDVLGVKTLTVLRLCILNMQRDPQEGLGWIPLNHRPTFSSLAQGNTDGVFQLEGWTSQRGCRRLKPNKIDDVIAAMALFRPGVMNSGATDSYIARKHREQAVPERHKIIADATKETFGILLYQDQVIVILREMGMDADNLTKFLKAVKASNKGVDEARRTMEYYEPIIQQMCVDHGMTDEDVHWLWQALEAFAEYSFNRAHATIYGITAYRCAWLAINFPLEFHAALLAVAAGTDKEDDYKRVTRGRGIRLLRPDVNISQDTYTVDHKRQCIRRGLLSLDGIGPSVAKEVAAHQPYRSLDEFCEKVNPRIVTGVKPYIASGDASVGKLKVLLESGAMESLVGG